MAAKIIMTFGSQAAKAASGRHRRDKGQRGHDTVAAVQRIAGLDAATLDAAATRYLADLHALAPDKTRIVDKMPGNYLYLGLVGLLLPGARIIHCVRDPATSGCRSSPSASTAITAMRTISPISAGPSRSKPG